MSTETHGKHVVKVEGQIAATSGKRESRIIGNARRHRAASYDRGVQIAAAKVRVAADKKLKEATPEWIIELAAEDENASAS